MRRANVVSGLILSLFGLAMLFLVIPWQIDQGPADMMSPRLVPQIMMAVVVALAILLVALNRREQHAGDDAETPSPFSREEMYAVLRIGGVFGVSLALFEFVGPLAAGIALVAGSLLALGERRPLVLLVMPAGFLLALWILFYKLLGTAIM